MRYAPKACLILFLAPEGWKYSPKADSVRHMSDSSSDGMSPIAGPANSREGFEILDMGNRQFKCVFRDEDEQEKGGAVGGEDAIANPGAGLRVESLTPVDEEGNDRPLNERSKEELLKMLKESMTEVLTEKQKTVTAVVQEASRPQRPVLRSTSLPIYKTRTNSREVVRLHSAMAAIGVREAVSSLDDKDIEEELRFASGDLGYGKRDRVLKGTKEVKKVEAETSTVFFDDPGSVSVKRRLPLLEVENSVVTPKSTPGLTPGTGTMALPLIPWDEVKQGRELGRGQFATVWMCQWRSVNVAMKEWHGFSTDESLSNAVKEAETLAALRHPCVLSFYGMVTNCPSPAHVMELMIHGSLKDQLVAMRSNGICSLSLRASIALQAARGMDFLHSRSIIHFDLKSANLLCDLRQLDNPIVKIGDVGLSKSKLKSFVSGNMRGTLPWMAPELFPSPGDVGGSVLDRVNEMVDVYSFGVVLWEIWTLGSEPYPDLDSTSLLFGIMTRNLKLETPAGCDEDWAGLIEHCMEVDPSRRPQFDEIATTLEMLVKKWSKLEPPPSCFLESSRSAACSTNLNSPQPCLGSTEARFVSAESQDYLSATGSFDEETLV